MGETVHPQLTQRAERASGTIDLSTAVALPVSSSTPSESGWVEP